MSAPKYLVVKYIEDVWRMEPRNIGVIAWVNGDVVARFMQPAPKFIRDKRAYDDWLYLWEHKIAQDAIESADHTIKATKDSPDFLSVLKATGKDNVMGRVRHSVNHCSCRTKYAPV